jgi:mannose-6-phosphate isomerase-like protein (cupin superfamily)
MAYDTFSSGIQVLPPGCSVREHGHKRNHELIHIVEGEGRAVIDEITYVLSPGTTVLFGRNCRHFLENTGGRDMRLFWVFFPPGLEDWFHAIGRPRTACEPMPEAFPRPDDVAEIMQRMRFIPPRG